MYIQDELMAELEELEQEELDKNLLEVGGTDTVSLPSVPSTSLPSKPGTIHHFRHILLCIPLLFKQAPP